MVVTIVTGFILIEPAAAADPPDGSVLSEPGARADQVARRAQATQLTARAVATAQVGDCPAVGRLEPEIRDLDPAYYDLAFARDPAIHACTGVGPPPVPPIGAPERRSLVVGAGLALSRGIAQSELRVGWMVHPELAVFATALAGVVVSDEGGYHLLGLGMRAGDRRLSLELRVGRLGVPSGCEFDDPCVTHNRFAWSVGLALELVQLAHFGLDLRGEVLGTTSDYLPFAGLGISLYL